MNGMKINLNVYYSAVCNLQCDYCAAAPSDPQENSNIRAAIQNNTFQQYVIAKCAELEPVTLGIWGLEPSINQDLWADFITPILEECPTIRGIFVSTNGILFNPATWYAPILSICNQYQRKIKLWVQFSIDGPGTDQNAINNLISSITTYETNPYFRVKLSTKSTLTADNIRNWTVEEWTEYMADGIAAECANYWREGCDFTMVGTSPTLVRPGNYTKEDGERWVQWLPDRPDTVPPCDGCAAGVSSFTIDYQGNMYDCQLKKNRIDSTQLDFNTFLRHATDLYLNHEIVNNNWQKLYQVILAQYCWANSTIDDLDSYIRIWGQGSLSMEGR